jgi:hypothetical protein
MIVDTAPIGTWYVPKIPSEQRIGRRDRLGGIVTSTSMPPDSRRASWSVSAIGSGQRNHRRNCGQIVVGPGPGWINPGPAQNLPDGGRGDLQPEGEQLSANPVAAEMASEQVRGHVCGP